MTQKTPDPVSLYEEAARRFRATLAAVKESQLNSPTPCAEWSVKALVVHNLKVAEFVHGVFTGNVTGDDTQVNEPLPKEGAVPAFDARVRGVLAVVKAPGAMENQLETPFGKMTGGQFLMMPFMDLLVHRWDLAKATGQGTRLEPHLVAAALALAPIIDGSRQLGIFAPAVPVPATASPQDKLIALTGRKP